MQYIASPVAEGWCPDSYRDAGAAGHHTRVFIAVPNPVLSVEKKIPRDPLFLSFFRPDSSFSSS
jgi:hypothetical protein